MCPSDSDSDAVFVDAEGTPRLVPCAVLFVDVLGVTALADGERGAVELNLVALDRALRRMYRGYPRDDSPWPAAMFSDTLVLAAPVYPGTFEESAIGGLIIQAGWLQLNFAAQGLFVRGAIALGDFHIRDGVIFGPALTDAHDGEDTVAVDPRIVLRPTAESSHRNDLESYFPPEESPHQTLLRYDSDGVAFVNYLALLLDEPDDPRDDPRDGLRMHREAVLEQLERHRRIRAVWQKYRWVADYHNDFVTAHLPGEAELVIDAEAMTPRFSGFVEGPG